MAFSPGVARSIVEKFVGAEPVLSVKGDRKGEHIKYAYRFAYHGNVLRHISIVRKPTEDGVTVYVNKRSATNQAFPNGKLASTRVKEEYLIGYRGRTGDLGLSSAAGGLSTLDPRDNDVLRLSVSSEDGFLQLLTWYFGDSGAGYESKEADSDEDNLASRQQLKPSSADEIEREGHGDCEPIAVEANDASPGDPPVGSNRDSEELNSAADKTGTGYESDPEVRRVVELQAVAKACAFYKERGYSVTEKGKPFDLLCQRSGEVIHVEVKGSRCMLDAIIVTTNEVKDARNVDWQSDLFLVDGIVLESDGEGSYRASGGRCRLATRWLPEDKDLTPTQYRYKLPPIPEAE